MTSVVEDLEVNLAAPDTSAGGSSTSEDLTSDDEEVRTAATEKLATAVAEAATELTTLLSDAGTVTPAVAQSATNVVSRLLDGYSDSQGSASSADAATQITSAVTQLTVAVTSGLTLDANGEAPPPVVLSSDNLDLTAVLKPATEIAAAPIVTGSSTGVPVSAAMPTTVLAGIDSVSMSLPISAVLYTSPINLHPTPTSSSASGDSTASPTVSFTLMQSGSELQIRGLSDPISIGLPYRASEIAGSPPPCIGSSAANSSAVCNTKIDCLFWNETELAWSSDGLQTVMNSDRSIGCASTHLTEFIAFESPTSSEELLETAIESTEMNSISFDALQCALDPARSWRTVPVIWGCILFMIALFIVLLTNAIYRDRIEMKNTLLLLAGKKREDKKKRREQRARRVEARRLEAQRKRLASQESKRLQRQQSRQGIRSLDPKAAGKQESHGVTSQRRRVAPPSNGDQAAPTPPASPPSSPAHEDGTPPSSPTHEDGAPPSSPTHEDGANGAPSPPPSEAAQPVPPTALLAATSKFSSGSSSTKLVFPIPAKPNDADPDSQLASARGPNDAVVERKSVKQRWVQARSVAHAEIVAERWHKDVDSVWKRLCMACRMGHTLCAGILFSGVAGYTRAQTVMVLLNSFAFELLMLCLFYSAPEPREEGEPVVTINIVGILIAGTYASLITVPVMVSFAWLYDPIIFVRVGRWVLRTMFCWPVALYRCCRRRASSSRVVPGAVAPAEEAPAPAPASGAVTPRATAVLHAAQTGASHGANAARDPGEQGEASGGDSSSGKAGCRVNSDQKQATIVAGARTPMRVLPTPRNLPPLVHPPPPPAGQSSGDLSRAALLSSTAFVKTPQRMALLLNSTPGSIFGITSRQTQWDVGRRDPYSADSLSARKRVVQRETYLEESHEGGCGGVRVRPLSLGTTKAQRAAEIVAGALHRWVVHTKRKREEDMASAEEEQRRADAQEQNVEAVQVVTHTTPEVTPRGEADPAAGVRPENRHYSYESLNDVLLKASLTQSWARRDWPAVRKILFGWTTNILLFYGMVFGFLLYGCELFEPRLQVDDEATTSGSGAKQRTRGGGSSSGGSTGSSSGNATDTEPEMMALGGNTDELIIAWTLSAFQRFVLHEPTLILAAKGLPILFASAFCTNLCGETIVNLLTLIFEATFAILAEFTRG